MKRINLINQYRNSLKKQISATFLSIYIVICLIVLFVFITVFASHSIDRIVEKTPRVRAEIEKKQQECPIASKQMQLYLMEVADENFIQDINIYDEKTGKLLNTTKEPSRTYLNYADIPSGEMNILTALFPKLFRIANGFYTDQIRIGDENEMILLVQYPISTALEDYFLIIKLLSITMLLGILIFIPVGSYRTKLLLMPIKEMTETAKKINGNNLNLRIAQDNARFELKELAGTINNMMDRIQLSYDKQKRFVSDVSHELRTPIAVISGYANMLDRWGKDDKEVLDESIESIKDEADNMQELVEKLLFLARHDNETIKFDKQIINISQLAKDVVKKMILLHKDFEVEVSIDDNIYAYADEVRIRQLLRILIDNAIKYSPDRKQIKITLRQEEDNLIFSIKDRGIGIDRENLKNIFDRFYRADESRAKDSGGYGLGLSIAKIIVLGHNGKIKVRSRLNKGTEFIVILPEKRLQA